MTDVINLVVAVVGLLWSFAESYVVPASVGDVSLMHVAIWTPVAIGLVASTATIVRRFTRPRLIRTSRPTPAPEPATAAAPAIDVAPSKPQRRKRRRRKAKQPQISAEERAAQRAAAAATRAQERQQERERIKAEKAAQRAAERATRAQERQQERERIKAEKAAQRAAERATRAQERQQERERIKAEKAAQRAAERAARPPQTRRPRPPAPTPARQLDPTTRAFGSDPNRVYEFVYRVVPLDSLITSNTDTGAINPDYDPTLQPRQRDRAASQSQIERLAKTLVPESLLWDFRQLDKGAPIIGDDRQVESGNGRALALRRARADFPAQWERYQEALRSNLAGVGLDESALAGVESPVLVRERVTQVDRAAFAREANAPPVLQLSTLETARVDAQRISPDLVSRLAVKDGQSIDQALRSRANSDFVRGFVGTLSENEAATLVRKDGTLAQAGIRRIKAGLFVRTFAGDAGERLADVFLESLDSDIKNFETAISASLPVLSRAENLIERGERAADLSIAEDVSKSLDMLARLRESESISVAQYLEQSTLFERETTPFQDDLLDYFNEIGRSPKKIREFLSDYAAAVEAAPAPDQLDLFGESSSPTKEALFTRITGRTLRQAA